MVSGKAIEVLNIFPLQMHQWLRALPKATLKTFLLVRVLVPSKSPFKSGFGDF